MGDHLFLEYKLRLDRQLVSGQAQRLLGEIGPDTADFEHHPTGADHRDPVIRRALAAPHPSLGRFGGDRLVREYSNPDLTTSLEVVRDRPPSGLDLAGGNPTRLEGLDAELAERDLVAPLGEAAAVAAMLFSELDALWLEHGSLRLAWLRECDLGDHGAAS